MTNYYLPFGPEIQRSQDFGNPQRNAVMGDGTPHGGDDYACVIGTPVRAAGDGVIDFAQEFDASYLDNYAWNTDMGGLIIWLNCGDNAPSFEYAHLSVSFVVHGQKVKAGQIIGLSGNSGGSTGPHCHVGCLPPSFDLNTPTYGRVNPRLYMTKYWEDEENTLTNFSEDDVHRIVVAALGHWSMNVKDFAGKRSLLDTFNQSQAEHGLIVNTVLGSEQETIDIPELAKALAGQLNGTDVDALISALGEKLAAK